ncbi:transcriptional repressor [candidate division KSB1 bacterium]|nr:transcriptional repressor [candidate division KSB1 bacterium]
MNIQEQIELFIKKCRVKNLNVTPQRLTIYRALLSDGSHPNPDAIHKKIIQEHPTISFSTVYKTLEAFERTGIISLVNNLHDTMRYDPITKQHHHIICVKCKKIIDVFDEELDFIKIPQSVTDGNRLLGFKVHFNVICSNCRE